ncbi:MAG: hypothetical protein ACREBZ_06460 [Thermoplasmata archaeon]
MVDVSELSATWPYWAPVAAVVAVVMVWVLRVRSEDPESSLRRKVRRVVANDPVSRAYRDLESGKLRPEIEAMWLDVDGVFQRGYGIGLAKLPLRDSAAHRLGIQSSQDWRKLRKDLLRLLFLSEVVVIPPGILTRLVRRRQRAEFVRLVGDVLPRVENLPGMGPTFVGGSG